MSDVHFMLNDWNMPPMSTFGTRCPGHEGAGEVVKIGANVRGWNIGDRGGLKPLYDTCGQCEQCYNGEENYCAKAVYTGLAANGTYQQYVCSPARYTSRIPDGVSDYVAGPIMCSASTMHRALKDSGLKTGQFCVFPGGGGGVGIQGVQLAKAMGIRVIVIDAGEAKEKLAKDCGAEVFIDFKKVQDVPAEVVKLTGGVGAHGVIVTGYQAYKDAVAYTGRRVGATVICVAMRKCRSFVVFDVSSNRCAAPKDFIQVGAPPGTYAVRKLKITGSLVGTMQDTAACLEYAQRGLLKQICEVRGMSAFPESVQQLKRGEVAGRIVIDFNKD